MSCIGGHCARAPAGPAAAALHGPPDGILPPIPSADSTTDLRQASLGLCPWRHRACVLTK